MGKDSGKDSMSSERMGWLWTFLDTAMFDKALDCIASDFQPYALHPERRTTVLVHSIAMGLKATQTQQCQCLKLIKALRDSGASWTQASRSSTTQTLWKTHTNPEIKLSMDFGSHSALSFAQAWLRKVHHHDKEEWKSIISFLHKVFEIFSAEPQPRNKLAIDEDIVDLWEKLLLVTDSHDLTIDTAEGPVTAHAQMLKEASPVVRAMLESSMKERQTQRIQLNDTPREAVSLLLETLYTCSSQSEPDYKTVLSALDLAHRWQVQVVVRILGELLERMITDESFASIAEHAALKGLEALKKACQKFGAESKTIQDQLKKDALPKVVKELFHQETAAGAPRKKRKCF